jgi:LuxR family maltose regulon positive regulatory protein
LKQVHEGQRLSELQLGIDLAGCLVSRALPVQGIKIAIQALLLRAQMFAVQGNMEASLADLHQAVSLAEPEGYIRTFLDEGPAIAGLLKMSLQDPVSSARRQVSFTRRLLETFKSSYTTTRPGAAAGEPAISGLAEGLIERLTAREMDVLRLMAQGLKYQEIAGRLFITLNTVRFYVKEIYSKLNVDNRAHAIEAAREHHLL